MGGKGSECRERLWDGRPSQIDHIDHPLPHQKGATAVAFKVKTTQPKRYLVKPNQGVLEPGATDRIQIQIVPKDRA